MINNIQKPAGESERKKTNLWEKRQFVLACVLIAVLAVGATLAFLFDILKPKTNMFSFDNSIIDVIIDENEYNWDTKEVMLVNQDIPHAVPGVVRAMIVPVLKTNDGSNLGLAGSMAPLSEPIGNTMALGDFVFTFQNNWQDDWFFKDGFFYYRKVLQPGESTTMLLSGVSLADPSLAEKYKDMRIEVEVMADIIQAANGAPTAAWGVYVSGIVVSPTP